MADVIATLHRRNDPTTNIYPNVKDTNIPDTILRVADLGKYINLLSSLKISGDGDFISVTSDVGTFTTADITTLNVSGLSQFEGKATFGSDMEVDGGLTLNSPSDLHFKRGDTDYTDYNTFKTLFWDNIGRRRYQGMNIHSGEEEGRNSFIDPFSPYYTDISNYAEEAAFYDEYGVNLIADTIVFPDFGTIKTAINVISRFKNESVTFGNALIENANQFASYWSGKSFLVSKGKEFKVLSARQFFASDSKLEEVGEIDMSGCNDTFQMFLYCSALKSIRCKHWHGSLDISYSTHFEQSDLVEIIGNLDSVTSPQTFTMGATNLAKLTQDQILVATGKGWTLA